MESRQFIFRNSTIGYCRFGSGPRPAFCFHGFGEDACSFNFFGKYAGDQYTFYAIDLPFHGKTDWKDGLTFTPSDLLQIVEEVLQQNNYKLQTTNYKFTLLGFSLGGRIALSLFQLMPGKVEKLVLLAPDGLKINFWYWLSTQTWAGNKFFHFTMKHPGWFFGFLKLMNKLKLVNSSVFKFVDYYIGDAEVRRLLYARWTCLRKFRPEVKRIKSLIREKNCKVRLIYGEHDRIILSSVGERFRKGIEEQCLLSVIHSGHQVLHEKHISEILPALLH
ncbi:MAG TPA: alpha/beta hydrolase [Chitinophagaceae bacterium]|nr:alpha/beta hydrolase [Chitinophagaceae bacterium]